MVADAKVSMEEESRMRYEVMERLVLDITSKTSGLLLRSLRQILENEDVKSQYKNGIFNYIYIAGFLSLAGKPITKENIIGVFNAAGAVPQKKLVDIVMGLELRSHVIHFYAYYLLMVLGMTPDLDNICAVVESCGEESDRDAAKDILALAKASMI